MDADMDRRQAAIKRLEAKRAFSIHSVVYVLVNALLVAIWMTTGRGYFWPIWSIAGWGVGLAAHRWMLYSQKPFSEDDIRREMERGG